MKLSELPTNFPACYTVGDVMAVLEKLPKDLPVDGSFENGIKPVVFNRHDPDVHLNFQDNDGTWDD